MSGDTYGVPAMSLASLAPQPGQQQYTNQHQFASFNEQRQQQLAALAQQSTKFYNNNNNNNSSTPPNVPNQSGGTSLLFSQSFVSGNSSGRSNPGHSNANGTQNVPGATSNIAGVGYQHLPTSTLNHHHHPLPQHYSLPRDLGTRSNQPGSLIPSNLQSHGSGSALISPHSPNSHSGYLSPQAQFANPSSRTTGHLTPSKGAFTPKVGGTSVQDPSTPNRKGFNNNSNGSSDHLFMQADGISNHSGEAIAPIVDHFQLNGHQSTNGSASLYDDLQSPGNDDGGLSNRPRKPVRLSTHYNSLPRGTFPQALNTPPGKSPQTQPRTLQPSLQQQQQQQLFQGGGLSQHTPSTPQHGPYTSKSGQYSSHTLPKGRGMTPQNTNPTGQQGSQDLFTSQQSAPSALNVTTSSPQPHPHSQPPTPQDPMSSVDLNGQQPLSNQPQVPQRSSKKWPMKTMNLSHLRSSRYNTMDSSDISELSGSNGGQELLGGNYGSYLLDDFEDGNQE